VVIGQFCIDGDQKAVKMKKRPLSTYERIIPFKSIPYWLFWMLVGVLAFVSSEIIIRAYNEKRLLPFLLLRSIISVAWAGFPITLTWLSHRFYDTIRFASDVFWSDAAEFEEWLERRHRRIFTFQSGASKLIALLIGISVTVTYSIGGLPLENPLPKFFFVITGTLLSIMGGHTAYIIIDLLATLVELVRRDVQIPFFRLPHPAITGLQNYYSVAALIMTAGYSSLVIAGWQSPYGLSNPAVITWLSILAFFPLALFILSSFQIHLLMSKVKESQLEMVNEQVQSLFRKVSSKTGAKTYDQLEKAMAIQTKIQNLPEWPLSFASIFGFLITAATAIIQVVIPLLSTIRP